MKYNCDELLYVVDNSQHDYFRDLFEIGKRFPELRGKELKHVRFGRMHGLSTRKGKAHKLEDLITDAQETARKNILASPNQRAVNVDETAYNSGLSAIVLR